jgi:hypothetical protein
MLGWLPRGKRRGRVAAPGGSALAGREAPRKLFLQSHPFVAFAGLGAALSAALAIPLYLAGATYLSRYYSGFGLHVTEMGFSVYDTLLAAPLQEALAGVWPVAVVALVAFLLALLLGHRKVMAMLHTPAGAGALIGLALAGFLVICSVAFFLGDRLGQRHALRDMTGTRSQLSTIAISLVPSSPGDALMLEDFDSLEHRLIAHGNGYYYIFRPLLGGGDSDQVLGGEASIMVYAIPDSRVQRARIQQPIEFGGGE